MPNLFSIFSDYFFAPQGAHTPCGMFSFPHLLASAISLAAVAVLLIFKRKEFGKNHREKIVKSLSIFITVLELIKISHSFIYGDLYLDAWFPLSYCGLFIFALWMAGFGSGAIRRIGEVFIAYGCPIAGIAFLIFPTTSLMLFPVWHYFSLYSLFFHSVMIFLGISFLLDEKKFDRKSYGFYTVFFITFAVIAIVLNCFFGSNLMNLREPYNIPIDFLQWLYASAPFLYTLLAVFLFMLVPIVTAFFANKFKLKK